MMEQQVREAMQKHGINPPDNIIFDGVVHRFGKKDVGWYIMFDNGIHAGCFGDWSESSSYTWCSKNDSDFTPEERRQFREQMELAKQKREKEKKLYKAVFYERFCGRLRT